MGANANAAVAGVSAASDTSWGWWNVVGARAATYTFTGSATADAVIAPGGPIGPNPKFGPGVNPTAIAFTPLLLSARGALGSAADASMMGSSNVGIAFYGCDVAVSATAAAAPAANAKASASATAKDPWDVTYQHRPGRKSYVLVSVQPDFSLAPGNGASGATLSGSFGEIALSLRGSDRKPKAAVSLAPGWLVYDDVRLPVLGHHIKAPKRLLTQKKLEALFLRQHTKGAPFWLWNQPAPTLTFVKEVPPTVASERIEVSIGVSDDDAGGGDDRQRRKVRR